MVECAAASIFEGRKVMSELAFCFTCYRHVRQLVQLFVMIKCINAKIVFSFQLLIR